MKTLPLALASFAAAAALFAGFALCATANSDRVAFPEQFESGVKYATVQRSNITEDIFTSGWGAEYPPEKRNGEWEFQAFNPDRSVNCEENLDSVSPATSAGAERFRLDPRAREGRQLGRVLISPVRKCPFAPKSDRLAAWRRPCLDFGEIVSSSQFC